MVCSLARPAADYAIPGELYEDEVIARRRARELKYDHPHAWLEEHVTDEYNRKTLQAIFPNPELAFHMDAEGINDVYGVMCAYYKNVSNTVMASPL